MSIFEDIFRREWEVIPDVEDVFDDDEDDEDEELSRGELRRLVRAHGPNAWKSAVPFRSKGDLRRAERKMADILKEENLGRNWTDS